GGDLPPCRGGFSRDRGLRSRRLPDATRLRLSWLKPLLQEETASYGLVSNISAYSCSMRLNANPYQPRTGLLVASPAGCIAPPSFAAEAAPARARAPRLARARAPRRNRR